MNLLVAMRRKCPKTSEIRSKQKYSLAPYFHLIKQVEPRLVRTPRYYGQFTLPLGKRLPYIFSKFNPVNTVTSYGPLVSVLRGSDCIHFLSLFEILGLPLVCIVE